MRLFNYIFIILMSIGALIPNSDFSQLMKIKELSEHYQVHKSEALLLGDDFGFCDFLYLHFITGDDHDHDESDHDDLPLKQFTSGQNFYLGQTVSVVKYKEVIIRRTDISAHCNLFLDEGFLDSVFQPPAV